MNTEEYINDALIIAYLKGEPMLAAKKEQVEEWLRDEANSAEAAQIYKLWEISLLEQENLSEQKVNSAFLRMQQRISQGEERVEESPKGGKTINLRYWMGLAAGLLILALAYVYLYLPKGAEEENFVSKYVTRSAAESGEQFQLSDNSLVSMDKLAEISYDSVELLNGNGSRLVKLTGKAFFEVSHDETRPFIVETSDARVEVLGTKFMVNANDESPTQVLVTEGKVRVTYINTGKEFVLKAKEEIDVESKNEVEIKASDENKLYWKTGVMTFVNSDLNNVFNTLQSEFHKNIEVENNAILDCEITATFKKQSLNTIIQVIQSTHNLQSSINGDTIIISGNGCK